MKEKHKKIIFWKWTEDMLSEAHWFLLLCFNKKESFRTHFIQKWGDERKLLDDCIKWLNNWMQRKRPTIPVEDLSWEASPTKNEKSKKVHLCSWNWSSASERV